jgi:hypothetical protein
MQKEPDALSLYYSSTGAPTMNYDMGLNAVSTSNASTVSSFTLADALNFK